MTDKTNKMLVTVVLDRSGSMNSQRAGTISGYNEYINGLRADKEGEYSVSLIQFDAHGSAHGPELTISYTDKPLADVPVMTEPDYEPRGGTPLLDAIGECIRRASAIKGERAATCVIITDGQENSSKEFTLEAVRALIKEKEAESWTFVFIGAEIDSYAQGGALGMSTGNVANYAQANVGAMYTNTAQATVARGVLNRSRGVHGASMMSFFSDDQKAAMGDKAVPTQTTVQPQPAAAGGQPAGAVTFPKKPAKVERRGKSPRKWAESSSR